MLNSYHNQSTKIFISTALRFIFYVDYAPLNERVLLLVLSLYFQEQNADTCLETISRMEK